MSAGFIPPHGGFEGLITYQKSCVIFRATYYLTERWVRLGSRTRDQMEQAARSGKQNIVEGSLASATSKQTEIHLANVARASLGELLEDFKDFLVLRGCPRWDKDSEKALKIRRLANPGVPVTYELYQKFIESDDPEIVGNTMVCLLEQSSYLLDQQVGQLERDFLQNGGIRERMTQARLAVRNPELPPCPLCGKPMRERMARTGPHAGQAFWGCSGYPECKGIRNIG
ncbi:MAG: four helix bundle suffix domain-containing protein [bacterium]